MHLIVNPSHALAACHMIWRAEETGSVPCSTTDGLLFPLLGSTSCRLRYCLACFFRRRLVLPAVSTTARLAFSAAGQYFLPSPLLPGLLFPLPGSTPRNLHYRLTCFFHYVAVLPAVFTTAWLAFSALGQYSLHLPLPPGLLFPSLSSTPYRLRYCRSFLYQYQAVHILPNASQLIHQ